MRNTRPAISSSEGGGRVAQAKESEQLLEARNDSQFVSGRKLEPQPHNPRELNSASNSIEQETNLSFRASRKEHNLKTLDFSQ